MLGEATLSKNLFHAEIRGLTQFLSQTMCDTYLPHCRANLGDYRCGFDLNQRNYRVDSRVSVVIDAQTFKAEELTTQRSDWFSGGYISWQSGSNKLLKMEVKEFASSKVVLSLPMAFNINIDDRFIIFAGCDKSSKTCQEKFDNIINFRGEPDLPGIDKLTNARR